MALPFLESMAPSILSSAVAGETAATGITASGAPLRSAFIFVPNGVNQAHWVPKDVGPAFALPNILEPLANVQDDLLVLSGLANARARHNSDGGGGHARGTTTFLTGVQCVKTYGKDIRAGISVDQLMAASQTGQETRLDSLVLTCESGSDAGNCDTGYSCAYNSNVSWRTPTTPAGKELDPRRVFDRLFAGHDPAERAESRALRLRRKKSVLDFVLDDSLRLRRSVAENDRRKIDEYFNNVRDIERRLERSARHPAQSVAEPAGLPAREGEDLDWEDRLRLMLDLLVLAFQTDSTRVASLMLAPAASERIYHRIGMKDGHHWLSHHQHTAHKLELYRQINRYHVSLIARFLERLKSTPEGDGTLLDNCMILYGCGIGDGNGHTHFDLPVLLAGRGGGTIDSGRHVRFARESSLCNLFVSMLNRMGVSADRFGDSTGAMSELTL